jgi:cytoskeletal protein RodZ
MSVGVRLTEAREHAGLTVEDVSRATRIRGTLIRAIEADDFGPCGGSVYARGHIRSICQAIGVDSQPMVDEYDAAHGTPVPVDPTPVFDPEVAERTGQRRPNWTGAMAAVLAMVSIVAGIQLVSSGGKKNPTGESDAGVSVGTGGNNPLSRPTTAPSVIPAPRPTDAVAFVNPKIVTLRVLVTGSKSWVSITGSSGKLLFQGILRRGVRQDFTDPKLIRLVIGDSGAVTLVVNGHNVGSPGPAGMVFRGEFAPGDPDGAGG